MGGGLTIAIGTAIAGFAAASMALAAPQTVAPAPLLWHPGLATQSLRAAPVVRIAPGFHWSHLAEMRDDQVIETQNGRRVPVARLKRMMAGVALARQRVAVPRPARFPILPAAHGPCVQRRPGETQQQLLARPDGQIICTANGSGVSVAQLRAMAPSVVNDTRRSAPAARVTVRSFSELGSARLQTASDSTVLVGPGGKTTTLGALRALFKADPATLKARHHWPRPKLTPAPMGNMRQ